MDGSANPFQPAVLVTPTVSPAASAYSSTSPGPFLAFLAFFTAGGVRCPQVPARHDMGARADGDRDLLVDGPGREKSEKCEKRPRPGGAGSRKRTEAREPCAGGLSRHQESRVPRLLYST